MAELEEQLLPHMRVGPMARTLLYPLLEEEAGKVGPQIVPQVEREEAERANRVLA